MLLIDGVKYELWTPRKEVEEFHPLVKEHYEEIFGSNSLFIEGNRLESGSGKGSVPDGFVITTNEAPQWYIVEMELSTHQLYDHIVNQVGRFINGIKTTASQKKVVDSIYQYVQEDKRRKAAFEEAIDSGEIFKFIADLVTKPPVLVVIIEDKTQELDEALDLLKYSPIKIVEFQTFRRAGAEAVHAHLFEPLYRFPIEIVPSIGYVKEKTDEPDPRMVAAGHKAAQTRRRNLEVLAAAGGPTKRITIQNLIDARILRIGQTLWGQRGDMRYEGKIIEGGGILLSGNPTPFDTPSGAAVSAKGTSEDGWRWWRTKEEDGRECALDELRKQFKRLPPG